MRTLVCTDLLYLIYSQELWFLHPGALILLVGFYVPIVHCGIILSDLLHVKSLLKFFVFFFLLWEPENPFHVKIAACLWTLWLITIWLPTACKIFFFWESLSASTVSTNAELKYPCTILKKKKKIGVSLCVFHVFRCWVSAVQPPNNGNQDVNWLCIGQWINIQTWR